MATADQECFVYVVLPGQTRFVTAGRFALRGNRRGGAVGGFVYGRSYRQRPDAVDLDPVELQLSPQQFQTARMGGFSGCCAMPCRMSGAAVAPAAFQPAFCCLRRKRVRSLITFVPL